MKFFLSYSRVRILSSLLPEVFGSIRMASSYFPPVRHRISSHWVSPVLVPSSRPCQVRPRRSHPPIPCFFPSFPTSYSRLRARFLRLDRSPCVASWRQGHVTCRSTDERPSLERRNSPGPSLPLRPRGLERNRTSPCARSEPTSVTWIRKRRCRETKGRSRRPLVRGIRRCVGWTRRRWSLDETSEGDARDTVSSGTDLAEKRKVSRVACIDSFLPRARHARVSLLSSLPPRTCVVADLSFVTDSLHDALPHHLRGKPRSIPHSFFV